MDVMRTRISKMLPVAAALLLVLGGCGEGDSKPKATQVAVKVNGSEISVHQLNAVLGKLSGVTQENVAQVRQDVLGKLVDQQLAYDQALDKKLDRNPDVMMAVEAAKREIVARAYLEQIVAGLPKPTDDDAHKYYAENPALFSQRKIYSLQEIALDKDPVTRNLVNQELTAGHSIDKIAELLKSQNILFRANAGAKAAEQLPLDILPKLAGLSVGQVAMLEGTQNNFVVRLEGAQLAPVDEATARPRILAFLQNTAAQKAIEAEITRLKSGAKIEFVGEFAQVAPATAAVQQAKPVANEATATTPNLEKGVKGLK